ncbi:MAG: hypothetical protein GF353_25350 [Candidatus Lokiarchaeota archaeon]|nr:hypothetical protein [Candidatus Lokiarchaeota archaeon]
MKLPIFCVQCATDKKQKTNQMTMVDIRDDGLYQTVCENNHVNIVALQQQKFEILFDIGAYAILDGYYREAVSSFTTCIERFYEYYIKVISLKHEISEEVFLKSWKIVSKQSERQLGAFIYLFTIEKKCAPTLLSNSNIEFRNAVIHKGKIPEEKDAIKYGNDVLKIVRPILYDLKMNYTKYVDKTIIQYLEAIKQKTPDKKNPNVMFISTVLSIAKREAHWDKMSLENFLVEMQKNRKQF